MCNLLDFSAFAVALFFNCLLRSGTLMVHALSQALAALATFAAFAAFGTFPLALDASVDGSASSTMDNGIANYHALLLCVDGGATAKDIDRDELVIHQHAIGQDELLALDEEVLDLHVTVAVVPGHKVVKDVSCRCSRRDAGRDLPLRPLAASAQRRDGNNNLEHLADNIYVLTWISLIYPGNGAAQEKIE
jgi:hypothetical protein